MSPGGPGKSGRAGRTAKTSGPLSVGEDHRAQAATHRAVGQSAAEPEGTAAGGGKNITTKHWAKRLRKRRSPCELGNRFDSHFPTATTTTNFRLHLKCLDGPS